MSTSKLTEGDLTPLPLDIMGRQTTKEDWEKYEMDTLNHIAKIRRKRDFLEEILKCVAEHGIEPARHHFKIQIEKELFMDAPAKPGQHFSNND